jgi:hypothetical protein
MATLNVGRSSAEAGASPDPSWKGLYQAGGISAIFFFILNIVVLSVFSLITPQPPGSGEVGSLPGGVATLQYIASTRKLL